MPKDYLQINSSADPPPPLAQRSVRTSSELTTTRLLRYNILMTRELTIIGAGV